MLTPSFAAVALSTSFLLLPVTALPRAATAPPRDERPRETAAQPDSGDLVREPGGWTTRGGALEFGPYKATRIRERDRRVQRRGHLLLGARHETWRTEFDLSQSPVPVAGRTSCRLDRLVNPGMDVKRPVTEQHLFRLDCTAQGDSAWTLAVAIPAVPTPDQAGADANGWAIGEFATGAAAWSLVAHGARHVVGGVWTHPHSLRFRGADGAIDAEVFVRDRRRVWINPRLSPDVHATLARAAVALLVAGPLVAADDLP